MLKSATYELGSDVFVIEPLLGEESFVFQSRVAPLVAEIMGLFGVRADAADLGALLEAATPIVARAARALPPEELRQVMRILLKGTTVNGKPLYSPEGQPLLINVVMQGRTIDVWKLLVKSIEVSYPDFFDLLRAYGVRRGAAASSETSSTSTPGPAGASSPAGGAT